MVHSTTQLVDGRADLGTVGGQIVQAVSISSMVL
jgi:hypothetical protein